MANPDVGHGAALTFQSGFAAKILDLSWSGISREAHDISNFSTTGGMEFVPGGLFDPGELQVEILLDEDADPFVVMNADPETVTLTFPTPVGGTTGATWAAQGFATGFEAAVPAEEKTGTLTIKFSGDVTTVDAA